MYPKIYRGIVHRREKYHFYNLFTTIILLGHFKCTDMLISQFSLNIFVPISAHELDFSNVCITSRCKMRKIILSLFAQSTTFSYKAFIIIIQIYTECVSTILTINQSLSNRASQMEGNNVFPIKRSLTNSLVFV